MSYHWHSLKNLILLRRVPHGVVSWRYLLPGQNEAVKLHRKVFLRSWPTLNRLTWFAITLYSLMLWYGFFSWLMMFKAFFRNKRRLQETYDVAPARHLFDLFRLSLLNGIAPGAYYQYQLFRQPEKKWLSYIYDQELPHWHRVLSKEPGNKSLQRINNKQLFSQTLQDHSIACVETHLFIAKGKTITAETLFSGRNLFGKPNQGNQGIGSFALIYDAKNNHYLLRNENEFKDQQAILNEISRLSKARDYLLQPLLRNHPDLANLCNIDSLCTLRVVTTSGDPASVVHATLEIPVENQYGYIYPFRIDIASGLLSAPAYPGLFQTEDYALLIKQLSGQTLPFWGEARQLCIRAHALFDDVNTIGWDVAISAEGVSLLEANLNWRVSTSQMLAGTGALDSGHYPLLKSA